MNNKYFLPKIKELNIYDYDLYKCPLNIVFSEKLNVIFGTNGLGKTTLLNILQYSIIGPYKGKVDFRNWKDQQKMKRPMYDKSYFKNRMKNQCEKARVQVKYTLGDDSYEVWHSLYQHKLLKLYINGIEVVGDEGVYDAYEKKYFGQTEDDLSGYLIDKYHKYLEKSSNFPDINSYILMITEVMFFTEARTFVFWNQDLCKLILSKFMTKDKYFEYDSVQKLIKKYDSQARLISYKMSMVKDFLGDDFSKVISEKTSYSLEDLQKANAEIDKIKARIDKLELELRKSEKAKTNNRLENEQINKKIIDIENKWYENIFPENYQEVFNRYVPTVLSGKCPFCGEEHIDKKINVENCFFCNSKIETKEKTDLNHIEIELKDLKFESQRLKNNYELLQKEISRLKTDLLAEEKDLYNAIEKQQKIKAEVDIKSNDNYAKYQQLETQKKKYTFLLAKTKQKEQDLALEIDNCIKDVFLDYSKTFKHYAHSFLGKDKKIGFELVGKDEDAFFRFSLDGTERDNPDALSESQRIFVDMAYRLSTLEFFHNDAYYISETPDSTLDYFFEDNAVSTFSHFIESGNTLFLSANARNSKLINKLVEKYRVDLNLINLLEISNLSSKQMREIKQLDLFTFIGE